MNHQQDDEHRWPVRTAGGIRWLNAEELTHVLESAKVMQAERVPGATGAKVCSKCGRHYDKPECPYCAELERRRQLRDGLLDN
ncbi:hypothetical protein [Opitutus sp. ER46]|uniref:hypothetical protein n=1 Tax=Opitutus sp. ER46 TaxID=2161864 RepID=UPI0011B24B2A|nr:hypothetical protein [Opitutus sp. ER46]